MFVQITTAVGCACQCVFCPQDKIIPAYAGHGLHRPIYLHPEMFKLMLRKLPTTMNIVFCGFCEPFQNQECTNMILYAHRQHYTVEIYTTLVGLSLPQIKSIFKEIHFDGKDRRFRIHLASEGNLERIPVTDNYLAVLEYILNSDNNIELHYHGETLNKRIQKLLESHGRSGEYWKPDNRARNLLLPWVISPERKKGIISCKCWGRVIMPDGTVLVCPNDWAMKYPLGNILRESYDTIFKHRTLKYFVKSFTDETLETPCRHCAEAIEMPTPKFYSTYQRVKKFKKYLSTHHKPAYRIAKAIIRPLRSALTKNQ